MSDHSILPPSSAARRVACPGSRALEALYPQSSSDAALEGDAAHIVAALYLKGEQGKIEAYNYIDVTPEMHEGAQLYYDFVMSKWNRLSRLHIEERVNITDIHPDCWGTPDCWFQDAYKLHIFDYKYGHSFVEVYENWQLIEYAAGILPLCNGVREVHFHIVQPRSFHPQGQTRSWVEDVDKLKNYFYALQQVELASMQSQAICTPSPQCNYCAARHACPALAATALQSVDIIKLNTPHNLKPLEVDAELRLLQHSAELLTARITGLEAEALNLLQSGKSLPHFFVDYTKGRDIWTKPASKIAALGELAGVDLKKPLDVITPKQAVKAGLNAKLVAKHSQTNNGKAKLGRLDQQNFKELFND